MEFDESLEDPDFRPFVSVTVRTELSKLLKSTTRIVVNEVDGTSSRKCNGLTLSNRPGQYPSESAESIAEAVTQIMHQTWSAQETEDPDADVGLPPVEFVISCEHKTRGTNAHRQRNQFRYVYHADNADDWSEDTTSLEERATIQIIGRYESLVGQLMSHANEAHDRLVNVVTQSSATAAAGADMIKEAIPMFIGGIQSMLNAKYMEYSAKKAEADAAASSSNLKAVMETVGPFIPILGMQIMAKMGFDPGIVAAMMNSQTTPADASPGDPSAPSAPAGPSEGGTDEQPEGQPTIVHRLAALVDAFGRSISPAQRREMNKFLTKRQQAAFDDLFCSTTDGEAYQGYLVVMSTAADKLKQLDALLDTQQRECFQMFFAGCVAYGANATKADEADPAPA